MPRKTDQRTSSGTADNLLKHAKETTSNVVDQVQQQAGSRLDRRKEEAAKELEKVAGAVRQFGQGLGDQEQSGAAYYYAARTGVHGRSEREDGRQGATSRTRSDG